MAANQVDFKILPSDQFSVYSPATRSDKVITYFTLLSKLRGDILSVGQDDDPNNIVSAFYSSVGGTQTLHLVKADGSEVTASVPEPTVGTVTSVNLTASTGISVSGGPITTSGSITVTNTAPDQVVVLTGAGTTSISGTYPSFTITSNDQFVGTVTSVGLTMPAAFSVANSPVTTSGTLAVTAAGLSSQYIRGDGQLANFPTPGGGGSSVNYYLNGSVSQGTFGGVTYYELSKTPIAGAGTNFTRTSASGDGYVASFITDANDPDQINIPGGNFNLEFYFNSSSSGGSPAFYGELYKVSVSSVFTLIASGLANSEVISGGTAVDQYYTSISVPQTALLATDRLAIRVYVIVDGRNITLHTENSNFSEVITTFSTGLNSLNGLSDQVQYFAVGTSGTDFAISSSLDTHTFNLPTASATNRGALSSADWTTFNGKQGALTFSAPLVNTSGTISIPAATGLVDGYLSAANFVTFNGKQNAITLTTTGTTGAATLIGATLNIPNYADQFVGTVTSVNLTAGTGITVSGGPVTTSGSITVNNNDRGSSQNIFKNFAVAGQSTIVADTNDDTLTVVAGTGVTITTNDATDTLTISATGSGGTVTSIATSAPITGGTITTTGTIGITQSGVATDGYLSSTDWNTFNSKEPTLTKGNLTEATSSVLTITGGTGAVIGSGTTIQVSQAGASASGFLSSTDWNTFNNKQGTITLTTTGSTGAATFISNTLNIPNYADQFVGTVTSVNMSVPTGFAISGNPITTSGTLAVAFDTGYSLPTNASQTTWNTAYNDSITAFAYNTSTAVLTLTQQDAGTLTATVTLQPFSTTNLAEGTNLYYTDARARLALSAGTGISYSTTTGVITNSAPDQTVVLTGGTGISTSGTYPSFTITNTAPDLTVVLTSSTGISVTGTYPSFTIANTAPDQTVVLTGGTGITTSGTYPSFTVTNSDRGSSQNIFKNIAVAGQSTIVADVNDDTLTVVAGSGVTITTNDTTDTITISATGSGGSVTSVATTAPITGGTITTTGTIGITQSGAAADGYLSSTDWGTFNSKQGAITLTTTGSTGAATFISNTLNIPNYGSALSSYLPLAGGTLTGNLTVNAHIILPQNPVGTTYGNGVAANPTYMISQAAGDNDAIRLYSESAVTNSVSFILEVNDDIETVGNEWIFRNKKTYGDYAATTPFRISGSGAAFISGNEVWHAGNITPVPTSRTITINGTSQDLSANRTFTVGTVTSVGLTGGTGITISGGPITTSGSITVTNSAPDQTVVLTGGTGITTSGTYPSFTVTNSAPDQTVALTAGTGISISGTYPSFTITNTSAGGGTITGSGTTNYVPKWTSGSAIGDSAIYDNAGNVGIGTTAPSAKLHVSGGDGIINNALIGEVPTYTSANAQFSHTSRAVAGEYSFLSANDGETFINSKAGYNIRFRVNNADKVIINSSGNVGIGTTSPAKLLSVRSLDNNVTPFAGFYALNESQGVEIWYGGIQMGGSNGDVALSLASKGAENIVFKTNSSEKMRIRSDGNVLIGTTTDNGFKLNVNGSGYFNGAGYFENRVQTNNSFSDANNVRVLKPLGGSRNSFTPTETGAIKITYPVGYTNTMHRVKLNIYNYASNQAYTVYFGGYNYSPGPYWVNVFAYTIGPSSTDFNPTVRFGYDGTKMVVYVGELNTSWSYPQFFIEEVETGFNLASQFATDAWSIGLEASAFQNVTDSVSNTQATNWARNGSSAYYGFGNVGIGTTAPAQKLDVISGNLRLRTNATGLGPSIILNNGTEVAGNYSQIAFGGTQFDSTYLKGAIAYVTRAETNGRGDFYFLQNTANSPTNASLSDAVMVISNTGNVGIGTTAPASLVNIDRSSSSNNITGTPSIIISNQNSTSGTFIGGGIFNNPYRDVSGSSITAGVWFENQNSTDAGAAAKQSAIIFGAQSYGTGYNTPSERMRITAAGNVGIGTTAPKSKLQILGPTLITNNENSYGVWVSDTGDDTKALLLGYDLVNDIGVIQAVDQGLSWKSISIASNGGNVSIGTTTNSGARTNIFLSEAGATPNAILRLQNTGFQYLAKMILTDGTTNDALIGYQGGSTSATQYLGFGLGTAITQMVLTAAGNLGIGTTSPTAKLQVGAEAHPNATGIEVAAGAGGANLLALDSSTNHNWLPFTDGSNYYSAGSHTFRNELHSTDWMKITSAGNVLIATTTDSGDKLNVVGDVVLGLGPQRLSLGGQSIGFNRKVINGAIYSANAFAYQFQHTGSTTNTSDNLSLQVYNPSGGNITTNALAINGLGNVGIGTASPSYKLDVTGDARINTGALGVNIAPSATDGRIDASNDIVAFSSSDLRLKENIKPIENALEKVKSLTGVEFDWKPELKHAHGYEGHDTGVIAQEVQEVMPTAIRTNDTGYLAVRYEKLIGLLIEANKELAARVEELESKFK